MSQERLKPACNDDYNKFKTTQKNNNNSTKFRVVLKQFADQKQT